MQKITTFLWFDDKAEENKCGQGKKGTRKSKPFFDRSFFAFREPLDAVLLHIEGIECRHGILRLDVPLSALQGGTSHQRVKGFFISMEL